MLNQDINNMEWIVLNATSDDWENLEVIYRMLERNYSSEKDVSLLEDIADSLSTLYARGLIDMRLGDPINPIVDDLRYIWKGWFKISAKGLTLHSESGEQIDNALFKLGYSI